MRILLVRVSALGDAIHTLPALDLLKKQLPDAQIDWLVQQKNFGIVNHIPGIHQVYTLHDQYLRPAQLLKTFTLLRMLRNNRYDLVIDFQGLCKTSLLCAALDQPSIGFGWRTAREGLSSVVHQYVVTVPKTTNIIEKNCALARAAIEVMIGGAAQEYPSRRSLRPPQDEREESFYATQNNYSKIVIPAKAGTQSPLLPSSIHSHSDKKNTTSETVSQPSLGRQKSSTQDDIETPLTLNLSKGLRAAIKSAPQPSPAARERVTTWLHEHQAQRLVILTPNTTWDSKHWPVERWEELVSKLQPLCHHTIVCVGQKFGTQGTRLASFIERHKLPILIAPAWSLDELFAVMQETDLIVAPDTGLLHIADSIGVATIGLYGPTLVARHGPQITPGNQALCLQASCSHEYEKTHGTLDCMNKLSSDAVIERIKKVIY